MSITFPTFIDKEIVTPEKLNSFVQALESKFSAGLGTSEISWPLIAGGDLYMNDHTVVGGAQILGMINAGAPKYVADFATALTDGAAGCIFIPPSTAITMDGEALAGSSVTIIGSGPTSVLRLQASASAGYLLRNTSSGCKIRMSNLTLDGNGETGAGLQLRGAADVVLDSVWFTDFTSEALRITDLSGAASTQVLVSKCHFSGGSGYHIHLDDCEDVEITGCTFDTAAEDAIYGVAADTNASMKRINVHDNIFDACTKGAINIQGAGAFNTKWAHISVKGNVVDTASMGVSQTAIKLGATGATLQYVQCGNNIAPGSTADNISMYAQYGTINGNVVSAAGASCIDLLSSEDIVVTGNACRDGVVGITMDDSVDCFVSGNDTEGSTDEVVYGTSTSEHYNNNAATVDRSGPVSGWFKNGGDTVTIPGGTLRVGDMILIQASESETTTGNAVVQFDNTTIATQTMGESDGVISFVASVGITAATTATACGIGISGTKLADHGTGVATISGIDLTADIDVEINGPNGGNARVFVYLFRGIQQ